MFLTSTAHELCNNVKHLIDRGIDGLIIAQYIASPDTLDDYVKAPYSICCARSK